MRTYVVRVQDSRTMPDHPDLLRGVAEEVATGSRTTFTCGAELLRTLCHGPESPDDPRTHPSH